MAKTYTKHRVAKYLEKLELQRDKAWKLLEEKEFENMKPIIQAEIKAFEYMINEMRHDFDIQGSDYNEHRQLTLELKTAK